MRSPVWALTWELWRPYRRLWTAGLSCLVGLAALAQVFPNDVALQACAAAAAAFAFCFEFLSFTYGMYHLNLEGTRSGFPAHLLTRPVGTGVLTACPMLTGVAAIALTWAGFALLVLRPAGLPVDVILPSAVLAAMLAWLQAIAWSPFPLPWLRAVVIILALLAVPAALVATAIYLPAAVPVAAIGLVAAAYAVARAGVARARRGEGHVSVRLGQLTRGLLDRLPRSTRPFASAARAQLWSEWRRHGVLLPISVAVYTCLFLQIPPYAARASDTFLRSGMFPQLQAAIDAVGLPAVLLTPLFVIVPFFAMTGSDLGSTDGPQFRISSFVATLPMTDADLVLAKFRVAAVNTLVAWGIFLGEVAIWGLVTGIGAEAMRGWGRVLAGGTAAHAGAFAFLLGGLVLLTWKHQVVGLTPVLTGRYWLAIAGSVSGVVLLIVGSVLGVWLLQHTEYHALVRTLFPWLLGLLVLCKALAAGWALHALRRNGHATARDGWAILSIWLLTAAGLFAGFCWLLPAQLVPRAYLAAGVTLVVPLARLVAAPLAVAWNRHR